LNFRLLNEIIADFDELLGDERFRAIDKIKTIGSTYMAAIGLIPELRIQDEGDDGGASAMTAITELAEYIFGMREKLTNLNEHSYNNFMLRVCNFCSFLFDIHDLTILDALDLNNFQSKLPCYIPNMREILINISKGWDECWSCGCWCDWS
jgi:hypothetical protein